MEWQIHFEKGTVKVWRVHLAAIAILYSVIDIVTVLSGSFLYVGSMYVHVYVLSQPVIGSIEK